MANVNVRIRIDHPTMRAHVGKLSKTAVQRGATAAEERYRANIRATDRIDSGKMVNTVQQRDVPGRSVMQPAIAVGTPVPYVKFQEYGTRAHGPVRAKYLRFKPKGSSSFVFAKWVRGVRPARFAQNALDMMRPTDFE